MKEFQYTIKDACGIHARPAGLLVKVVKSHASTATSKRVYHLSAHGLRGSCAAAKFMRM